MRAIGLWGGAGDTVKGGGGVVARDPRAYIHMRLGEGGHNCQTVLQLQSHRGPNSAEGIHCPSSALHFLGLEVFGGLSTLPQE